MADKACGQTTSIFMKPALSLRLAALVGIAVVIAALFPSTPILPSPTLLAWSCAQVGQALAPFSVPALARVEAWAWSRWERSVQQKHSAIPLPVLLPDSEPTLSSPFVLRGLLNASEAFASFATTEWLQRPPIGDIRIHYFSNASRKQLVTPDSTGRVADVVAAIARGGPQKIGTESVIRAFPELCAPQQRAFVGCVRYNCALRTYPTMPSSQDRFGHAACHPRSSEGEAAQRRKFTARAQAARPAAAAAADQMVRLERVSPASRRPHPHCAYLPGNGRATRRC
eukprot:6209487-Pleurochrysis_carterae.AAC.4